MALTPLISSDVRALRDRYIQEHGKYPSCLYLHSKASLDKLKTLGDPDELMTTPVYGMAVLFDPRLGEDEVVLADDVDREAAERGQIRYQNPELFDSETRTRK